MPGSGICRYGFKKIDESTCPENVKFHFENIINGGGSDLNCMRRTVFAGHSFSMYLYLMYTERFVMIHIQNSEVFWVAHRS